MVFLFKEFFDDFSSLLNSRISYWFFYNCKTEERILE
jgi:hypothetical protein